MNNIAAGIRFIAAICLGATILAASPLGAQQTRAVMGLDPTALHLRVGNIPLNSAASLHTVGAVGPGSAIAPADHFVIQLDGPLTPQRQAALKQAGVHLGPYLPANAYIIRLPAGFKPTTALKGLPFVRWLGAFDRAWKIDPEIGTRAWQTPERQALAQQQRVRLAISLFAGEDLGAAAAQLLAKPGVNVTDFQQNGEYGMIELEMPQADVAALADIPEVQWVEEASEATLRNDTNRWILQSNVTNSTPVWDHGLTGVGQIGGHIDGGINTNHCFFRDPSGNPIGPSHRKIVFYSGSTTYDSHGTHTAGTFVGNAVPAGGAATYRGLAYSAKVAFTNYSSVTSANLLSVLTQNANAGARVHSNSWGEDNTTNYTSWCRAIDQFSFNNEDNLVLFAVTNGSGQVTTPENAKDCLAVAATQDTPNQGSHCSGGTWYTQDGRRKPEVMAPGCSTNSASGSGTVCTTGGMTGTSMACPAVAGAGLLAREYYTDGFYPTGAAAPGNAFTPSGALIKATLINSAVDCTGISGYPSSQEGYGRVLLDNALYFAGDSRKLIAQDVRNASGMTTGQSRTYNFTVNSNTQPLKVTLVWTEKEATVNANPAYINNLNLVVNAAGGATYLGNVFSGGQSATGGTADAVDNVELVLRNTPTVGAYTVNVNAAAVNTTAPQGFALVITGDVTATLPAPTVTSIAPNTGETETIVNITDLLGSNFQSGATVKLTKSGRPNINASGVTVVNPSKITCTLNLTGVFGGAWDVVVTNPDLQSAALPGGFTVTVTCTPGDMTNDGQVNGADIQLFINVMLSGTGTPRQVCAADINGDELLNAADVDALVQCVLNSSCP